MRERKSQPPKLIAGEWGRSQGSVGLIEKNWLDYRANVVPPQADETQVTETRRAFYAGAAILFSSLIDMLEPGAEATDADFKMMRSIQQEFAKFHAEVKAEAKAGKA